MTEQRVDILSRLHREADIASLNVEGGVMNGEPLIDLCAVVQELIEVVDDQNRIIGELQAKLENGR